MRKGTNQFFIVPIIFFSLLISLFSSFSSAAAYIPCSEDPAKLKLRSEELQKIVKADQDDRIPPIDWKKVWPRDEARRKRVGEIFGEGCFKEAKDYAAAALVYQHGNVPDHFFQTFIWAKRAVELGESNEKWTMAAGIDRYLVNIGHKQLFATQASRFNNECYCLDSQEKTFPEEKIVEYTRKTIAQQMEWVASLNQGDPKCKKTEQCNKPLKGSPGGTVPGFW